MKFLTTILSGFIGSPFVLGWFALLAVLIDVVYDKIIVPISGLYGHNLPDVPFWQWIALVLVIHVIQFIFYPTSSKHLTEEEMKACFLKKIGAYIVIITVSYLINWIWL